MLSLIVATDLNYGIGYKNKLLIHIPADLKRFKQLTSFHKIVMGMNTFNSLPSALCDREHIILSRRKLSIKKYEYEVVNDIQTIIDRYKNCEEEVFVIGGESIYNQLASHCNKFYITEIFDHFKSDTKFDWSNLLDRKLFNIKTSEGMYYNNILYKFLEITRK